MTTNLPSSLGFIFYSARFECYFYVTSVSKMQGKYIIQYKCREIQTRQI